MNYILDQEGTVPDLPDIALPICIRIFNSFWGMEGSVHANITVTHFLGGAGLRIAYTFWREEEPRPQTGPFQGHFSFGWHPSSLSGDVFLSFRSFIEKNAPSTESQENVTKYTILSDRDSLQCIQAKYTFRKYPSICIIFIPWDERQRMGLRDVYPTSENKLLFIYFWNTLAQVSAQKLSFLDSAH